MGGSTDIRHPRATVRRRAWGLARVVVAALVVLGTSTFAPSAGAGELADNADEVVRPIVFPVVGPSHFSDTFGACRSGCTRGHEGTDIMAPRLTPLVAVRDARVSALETTATPDGTEGNYVFLEDAEGWQYWYVHVNNDSPGTDDGANPPEWIVPAGIEPGARVRAGQLISWVGDSGNAEATAPHLHFEIHDPTGAVVNPYRSLLAAARLNAPRPVAEQRTPAEAFVAALHLDFLGRSASDIDLADHVSDLASGAAPSEIVDRFAGSDEWVHALVDGYYRDTLGRDADPAGRTYWWDQIRSGRTPATVAAWFYSSDEYHRRAGGTDAAWLADLYGALLDRDPDTGGAAFWTRALDAGTPRHLVALDFYQSLESRRARVTALYDSLLGRAPDDAGRDHWAEVLLDGRDLGLASFLASSDEYRWRAQRR